MASSSRLLSEEQFQCSICLDVFTEPVSTPCGHNFCKVCISGYWDTTDLCQCPMCKRTFYTRPELKTNTAFRDRVTGLKRHKLIDPVENMEDRMCKKHDRQLELFCRTDQTCVCQFCTEADHKTHHTVPLEKEFGERKAQLVKTEQHVWQMIQVRLEKVQKIKHSVEFSKKDTQRVMADSLQVFTDLMDSIEKSKKELIEEVEEKQKAAENQAEGFIEELEQEITDLHRRHTELEQLSHTEDHLHLLQIFPSLYTTPNIKDWSEISVYSETCVGNLRSVLRSFQYAVDVTLDPDTAYDRVVQSKDKKQLRKGRKNLPDNTDRFR
ncbi:unnamed protein product [Oncorhynchus mykiss]|uniref:Uncharacterized protein n=1 Tax=Oncorhynchus mykiss TaxID=8022 RepID=A0A060XS16_ONCMY|nr:unnamed protein product [Oncorhynchus mykiss]